MAYYCVIWLDCQHWTNYAKRQFNWKLILFSQPVVFMLIMRTQVSSRLTDSTSCFTDVCLILDMSWTCVRVHFIYDSQLLHLVFSSCSSYAFLISLLKDIIVATTRPVSNSSTSNKSQGQISSGEHELCNSQENLTGNHNSILLTIYINYPWSMLWLCICCASYPNVHALSSCPLLIYLMFYYSSIICLSQDQHTIYMCSDVIF